MADRESPCLSNAVAVYLNPPRQLALQALGAAPRRRREEETAMVWTTPILVEIRIGLEINGYLPAEF
jgi:coenzyme PQQ precursor peptide PqqA